MRGAPELLEAWVDGAYRNDYHGSGLLRALTLPPGTHSVEFVFRPGSVYLGIILAGIGILIVLIFSLLHRPGKQDLGNDQTGAFV